MSYFYRKRYTVEEFKTAFKTGDLICGWATGLTIRITAIGERRFLALDLLRKCERVCTMDAVQGWVKMERYGYEGTPPKSPTEVEGAAL